MGLRRSGHVSNVGPGLLHHFLHAAEEAFDMKPLAKLFRHEQFLVAGANNVAPVNASDRPSMDVRDFAASDYPNFKHVFRSGSFQRTEPVLRRWILSVSIPIVALVCCCCTYFPPTRHAISCD